MNIVTTLNARGCYSVVLPRAFPKRSLRLQRLTQAGARDSVDGNTASSSSCAGVRGFTGDRRTQEVTVLTCWQT